MIVLPSHLSDMARSPRWLLWRREGSYKLPIGVNERCGLHAATTGTFDACLTIWRRRPSDFDGLGYKPDFDDPYTGFDFYDLDHPTDDTVLLFWDRLRAGTYSEFSPSGTGGLAILRFDREAKQRIRGTQNHDAGLEIYSDSGFFAVTGRVIGNRPIAENSENLKEAVPVAMSTLLTNRVVPQIEKGRIYEKISKWRNAQPFFDMRDNWSATATWATPQGQSKPDRSMLMYRFVKYLVAAGARDPDLLWAIIKDSVVWREYSKRPNMLWTSIVPAALAEIPKPQPTTGQPVAPSFTRT